MKLDLQEVDVSTISLLHLASSSKTPIILVDSSWLMYKSYHGYRNRTSMYVEVGGITLYVGDIYGYVNHILSIHRMFPHSPIVLCLDSQAPKRGVLGYKAQRAKDPNIFLKYQECITAASFIPHVYVTIAPGMEADDLMHSLAVEFHGQECNVGIHTRDQDLWQTVADDGPGWIRVFESFSPGQVSWIREAEVFGKLGVLPKDVPMLKALVGDKSDNYAGYPRIPGDVATFFAKFFDTPDQLLSYPADASSWGPSQLKWLGTIQASPDRLVTNYFLAKILPYPYLKVFTQTPSVDSLEKYHLGRLASNLRQLRFD